MIPEWVSPGTYVPASVSVLAALVLLALSAVAFRRRQPVGTSGDGGRRFDGALMVAAALVVTALSAQGMWNVAGDALHLSGPLRLGLFAFAEVSLLAEATRARRLYRKHNIVGRHGVAVWVIAAGAGTVSALDADNRVEVLVRLLAPLLAAYLWHSGLISNEPKVNTTRKVSRITWRLSPQRVLVFLRLAEPGDHTVGEVEAGRRVAKLTRIAFHLHSLPDNARVRRWWLTLRFRRQVLIANAKLDLAISEDVSEVVRAHLGTLYTAIEGTSPDAVADAAVWRFTPKALPPAPADEETSPEGRAPSSPAASPTRRSASKAGTSPSRPTLASVEQLAETLLREHGAKAIGEPKASLILRRVHGKIGRDRAIEAKNLHNTRLFSRSPESATGDQADSDDAKERESAEVSA